MYEFGILLKLEDKNQQLVLITLLHTEQCNNKRNNTSMVLVLADLKK